LKEATIAGQNIQNNLQQSHQAEIAQRQAAANSMMQYYQTQQIINNMNRPINTTCTGFGNMVNCTTH
jgi:hypothetical protein